MVVGAFPVAKLGSLLLKQVSKPLAEFLKTRAKNHPFFRTYICMPPAQFYNWCEIKAKMWILNLGKPVNIPVLSEAMAIELGANLLGEAIIFAIAAGILLSELNRSSKKEAEKERVKKTEMDQLNTDIQDLFFKVEEQRTQISSLLRTIMDLEQRLPCDPPKKIRNVNHNIAWRPPPPREPMVLHSIAGNDELTLVKQSTSILLNAIQVFDHEFLNNYDDNSNSILSAALNHLYRDVYKLPLTMY